MLKGGAVQQNSDVISVFFRARIFSRAPGGGMHSGIPRSSVQFSLEVKSQSDRMEENEHHTATFC